jgi:hypothetical protein
MSTGVREKKADSAADTNATTNRRTIIARIDSPMLIVSDLTTIPITGRKGI